MYVRITNTSKNLVETDVMVSLAQVSAATTRQILLYFTHLDGGNVVAALLCLALAHRANQCHGGVGDGVLVVDDVENDNTGLTIEERRANQWRDRRVALLKLYTLGPYAFNRRFKMNRN